MSGTSSVPLATTIFEKVSDKQLTAYHYNDDKTAMTASDLMNLTQKERNDTITRYEPYKNVIIPYSNLQPENISHTNFKILYSFDAKTSKLDCEIVNIGIEQDAKTEKDGVKYRKSVFYIKPEN